MLWDRMGEQDKELEDDTTKREVLYRVIEKIRNMPKTQTEDKQEQATTHRKQKANQRQTRQNQQVPPTRSMYQQSISKDTSVRPE